MEKVKKEVEKKEEMSLEDLQKLMKLPEYESDFTLEDMLSVKDYEASATVKINYKDNVDNVIHKASKCDLSDERIALYGLSLGLTSIAGEKVTEDNLMELLYKHLNILPTDIVRLYNDMMSKHLSINLKKKQ